MKTIDKVKSSIFFVVFIAIVAALIVTVVNEAKINIAQVLLTFALVLITFIYAKRTVTIADATRHQAEASLKMAEEWNGLSINCDYGSILGEKFRSILRCETEENRSLEIIKLNSGDK